MTTNQENNRTDWPTQADWVVFAVTMTIGLTIIVAKLIKDGAL